MDAFLASQQDQDQSQDISQSSSTPAMDALLNDAKYSTPGQMALTAAEGAGEGVLGPVSPLIEKGLSALGVKGLSPEEQKGRAETNPLLHGSLKAAGFAGSAIGGVGLGRIATEAGEGAQLASGLGEASTIGSKLAASGVKASAEMLALQTSDELAKAVNQDPNQTLGSAAINIGLSGLIGGAGGVVLGTVPLAWNSAANKIGVGKLANDYMGEANYLDKIGGDEATAATNEVSQRMAEADQILNTGLKGQAISKTLPEATPDNITKIDKLLTDISDVANKRIEKAASNAYLKGSVSKLQQDLNDFDQVILDPASTVEQKWDALDDYKSASQKHANYNALTAGAEEKALSKWMKPFNVELREAAENSKVWGEAGNVQRDVNKANSALYDAQDDFVNKVTSKEAKTRVADVDKLRGLVSNAEKGTGNNKQNAVRNYLQATQDAADAVNEAHIRNGLEAPLSSTLNPTPVLDRVLNTPITPGRSLAQWANKKGAGALAKAIGETGASGIGGAFGALAGHPLLGAWAGEKVLTPIFSTLAKPFAETAVNSEAMKSSVDYLGNVLKGDKALTTSIENVFRAGEVIPEHLMPTPEKREKLQKSLDYVNNNPDNMMKVGGNIGHYLPSHATTAATIAATAQNYLNSLKPKQSVSNALDTKPPVDQAQAAKYSRALDIAQQPLLILQHVKHGTLLPQDVQTLNTIYPGLHNKMVSLLTQSIIQAKADGKTIPYKTKMSMGLLMGYPLDSTMNPASSQAIIQSAGPQQMNRQTASKAPRNATGVQLKQMNNVASMYQTPLESRQIHRGR